MRRRQHEGVQIEFRWALADWDEVPLNPTPYIEWIERGGPQDKSEQVRGEAAPRPRRSPTTFLCLELHPEQEVEGDELENELGWTNAL